MEYFAKSFKFIRDIHKGGDSRQNEVWLMTPAREKRFVEHFTNT